MQMALLKLNILLLNIVFSSYHDKYYYKIFLCSFLLLSK